MSKPRKLNLDNPGLPRPTEVKSETFIHKLEELKSKPGFDRDPFLKDLAVKYQASIEYWRKEEARAPKGVSRETAEEASSPCR